MESNAGKLLRFNSLGQTSSMDFENSIKDKMLTAPAEQIKKQIIGYLTEEGGKIPDGEIRLGTADIIESIFGKYKQYTANSPLKEVGKMILTIPYICHQNYQPAS